MNQISALLSVNFGEFFITFWTILSNFKWSVLWTIDFLRINFDDRLSHRFYCHSLKYEHSLLEVASIPLLPNRVTKNSKRKNQIYRETYCKIRKLSSTGKRMMKFAKILKPLRKFFRWQFLNIFELQSVHE